VHISSALIAKEAVRAFELNCALFATLQAPIETSTSIEPSLPFLGNPIADSTGDDDDGDDDTVAHPLANPQELRKADDADGSVVSLASVMAVAVAICLSQFLIVFGGLTGTGGYEKLQALEGWYRSVWASIVGS
jgi:hypothetical protein